MDNKIYMYIKNEPIEFILAILFWICIFLSLKWCSLPIIVRIPFVINILSTKYQPDDVIMGLVVGYLTGYGVYYLTTRHPNIKMREPIREYAYKEILSVYNKSIYLLLLLCKCTASEKEWNEIVEDTDIKCFNDKFYNAIEKFDINKEAYTLLRNKETMKTISWGEYLFNCYSELQKKYKEIYMQYALYLDSHFIKVIQNISECHYIEMMLGESVNTDMEWTGKDKKTYHETLPIYAVYESSNLEPIFAGNNKKMVQDYKELLEELYQSLQSQINNESSRPDYSISKIISDNVGIFEMARIK